MCVYCVLGGDMDMYMHEVRMSSKRALGSLEQELQLVMSCAMPVLRAKPPRVLLTTATCLSGAPRCGLLFRLRIM